MKRRSTLDFRTNVSQQGQAEPHAISAEEEEWALRATAAVGARFAGVDLLYDRSGERYVIEVNAVPGWRAFARVNECDVAGLVITALEYGPTKSKIPKIQKSKSPKVQKLKS
jgi:ribosomal protein S6--L-glutamate ligase